MNYETSTQRKRWLYTPEQLADVRQARYQEYVDLLAEAQSADAGPPADTGAPPDGPDGARPAKKGKKLRPPSLAEEGALLKYYQAKAQDMCRAFGFPNKVQAAAVAFLKRFYLARSPLRHDPRHIILAAVYLAGKVEEAYIGAEELCERLQQDGESVLGAEALVAQALNFDLITHSPYLPLAGLFADLEECQREGGALDEALQGLRGDALKQAQAAARAAVDALMLSDAPLLFPPGQLALAAMRSGCNKMKVPFGSFLARAARKASAGQPEPLLQEALVTELKQAFALIDAHGAEGASRVDADEVKKIDRRLKACHALLAKHAIPDAQPEADGRQRTLAAAVQRQELEDRGNPTIGSQREAEGEDPPQKRARVESAPA